MKNLSPDSFRFDLLEEAYRLRRQALARSSHCELDANTSMWVIRREAWRDLLASADFVNSIRSGPTLRNELLGLPVRLTINDEPDVPMIQLVMEPMLRPRG